MKKADDLKTCVEELLDKLKPEQRDASFDYCYNYFRDTPPQELIKNMEKSCAMLGFYLASWGMLRGSSFLLQKSMLHYKETVEFIAGSDRGLWSIDVDTYPQNIDTILQLYQDIKKRIILDNQTDLVIISKIMLGVYAIIPAYDENFVRAFKQLSEESGGSCRFSAVNRDSLTAIHQFYQQNKEEIDCLAKQTGTLRFPQNGEQKSRHRYSKAKIIDLYGWQAGKRMEKDKK